MARTSITIVLELDETSDHPAGSARLPDGPPRRFHGWLGLAEALDTLARALGPRRPRRTQRHLEDGQPPDPDAEPPDPDLELHGLLVGHVGPPDPDMPARRLLGNFTASLDEAATFAHLEGTVGDPSVEDPTGLASDPAVRVPAIKC